MTTALSTVLPHLEAARAVLLQQKAAIQAQYDAAMLDIEGGLADVDSLITRLERMSTSVAAAPVANDVDVPEVPEVDVPVVERRKPGPPKGFRAGQPRRNALVAIVDEVRVVEPVLKVVSKLEALPPGVIMSRRGTPEIASAIVFVLGSNPSGLTAAQIAAEVEHHRLRPNASGQLRQYISHTLSRPEHRATFQCSGRGTRATWTLTPDALATQLEAMRIVDELTDPAHLAAAE